MQNDFVALKSHIESIIVGQPKLIERLLTGVLADGHLLLEGLPGLAKTTAVRALASGMSMRFQRIQFKRAFGLDLHISDIFRLTSRIVPRPLFSMRIWARGEPPGFGRQGGKTFFQRRGPCIGRKTNRIFRFKTEG